MPVQGRTAAGRAKNTAAAEPGPRGRAEGSAEAGVPGRGRQLEEGAEQSGSRGFTAPPAAEGTRGKGRPAARALEVPFFGSAVSPGTPARSARRPLCGLEVAWLLGAFLKLSDSELVWQSYCSLFNWCFWVVFSLRLQSLGGERSCSVYQEVLQ